MQGRLPCVCLSAQRPSCDTYTYTEENTGCPLAGVPAIIPTSLCRDQIRPVRRPAATATATGGGPGTRTSNCGIYVVVESFNWICIFFPIGWPPPVVLLVHVL